jgi:sn-glycerol 3-phosphate transport system ATP-binding protein
LGDDGISATVTSAEYHGADTVVTARIGDESILVRAPGQVALAAGASVRLGWEKEAVHLFESASGARAA